MRKRRSDEEENLGFRKEFDLIMDPVIVLGSDGRVVYANDVARKNFEFGPLDHIGDFRIKPDGLFRGFDPSSIVKLLPKSPVSAYRLVDLRGRKSNVVVDVTPLETGNVIHFKDFSELAIEEKWKDRAVEMVSHELKNPLSAVKNMVALLLSKQPGPLTGDQNRFLLAARRNIDRLLRLLDDLLDISRLSSGKLALEPSWIEVRDFMEETVDAFTALFSEKKVDLRCKVPEGMGGIYVDATKLEQILMNLLINAYKFTHEGDEIEIEVAEAGMESMAEDLRLLPWGDLPAPGFVSFKVKDTGIGMNEETLANLFTPYYRNVPGAASTGSHLGLSISKLLVEVQGGHLSVESRLGLGTEATFCLPRDERTSYMMKCIGDLKRYIERVGRRNLPALFVTVGKESGECWMNLVKSWNWSPIINPADGAQIAR